ncbi:MAG TPA: hypothetical protein PKN09_00810 [Novosphingobium sp.]|nr:hypothetical protein [Novosphingobium sp.]
MSTLLILALLMALAFVGNLVWRGLQFARLAHEGARANATVVRKFRTGAGGPGSRGRRIAFQYTGPDGRDYRRAATIALAKWQGLEEGHPLEIYILPDKPGISAPAWLVDAARDALKKD